MKIIGYIEEYYVDNIFIGKIASEYQQNRDIGYAGMTTHIALNDIVVGKQKIRTGQKYSTIYYPINGR